MTVRFVSEDFGPAIEAAIRKALPAVQARVGVDVSSLALGAIAALGRPDLRKRPRLPTMADIEAEAAELDAIQREVRRVL